EAAYLSRAPAGKEARLRARGYALRALSAILPDVWKGRAQTLHSLPPQNPRRRPSRTGNEVRREHF
ncbi:hypothetical protein ACSTLD_23670, partial [Vibrio parahaemolyticus]